MSGVNSASIVGVKRRIPSTAAASGSESGNASSFMNSAERSPITTSSFGWTMCSSRVNQARASSGSSVPNLRQFVPYTASASTPSRCSDFSKACPLRPKKATPSWISAGCGDHLSRKMSASGCPEPSTGTCSSSPWLASSSPSAFASAIAFLRYRSEISSDDTEEPAPRVVSVRCGRGACPWLEWAMRCPVRRPAPSSSLRCSKSGVEGGLTQVAGVNLSRACATHFSDCR